jgi:integrase
LGKLFRTEGPVFGTTNFRREWISACVKVGLGTKTGECWYEYEALNPHDLRRSAVCNLTNAGVDQGKAMRVTGHKTAAVFERCNSKTTEDLHDASDKVVPYHADKKLRAIKAKSTQKIGSQDSV